MTFGEFVRTKRLANGLSLREFCKQLETDSSNWSKIERDRFPAPSDREMLERVARALKIQDPSDDWYKFVDLALVSQKKIPEYVYNDNEVLESLPIFFRTARGHKPTEEDMNKIIELLKRR